ncbi:general secretion pathway protein GspK [Hyphomonas oceanitis]|uniref:Type II secretion system protein K n=1 Tax=Hyphomonas oceanitis SCH89 TaxID=1280953 RepID=A0A059G516_9PROT|nr:type II secretion system protein GspK [Hyphomonas oceanitis]KDA01876.1 Type II secretory pathway component PulK-like protein [Hyphomonas oceanitis SCH89]
MKQTESGIVLVQVLVIVAFASAMALTLMTVQDQATSFTERSADRIQAQALLRGAEASVVSAFRQDGEAGSDVDHYGEAWYLASQSPITTSRGSLSVTIRDEQSLFNLNNLADGNLAARAMLGRIVAASGEDSGLEVRVAAALALHGPVNDLQDLAALGFPETDIAILKDFSCALPEPTPVNLNTASNSLIAALFDNPLAAGRLMALRSRETYISRENMSKTGLIAPAGTALTSLFISVDVSVSWGSAQVHSLSLLERRGSGARVEVRVIRRDTGI